MKTIKISTAVVLLSLLVGRVCADDSVMRGDYQKEVKAKKVVAGNLFVQEHAKFFGCAHVDKDLEVDGKLDVDGCADFDKHVDIHGSLKVHDALHVHKDSQFCNDVRIDDDLCVGDDASIKHDLCVGDDVLVGDNLKVCGDFFLKGDIRTRCDLHNSLKRLHEAYRAFDAEFNEKCCANFDFCYHDEKSSVIVHGPFTPDVCGHLGHILQPGSAQAFGKSASDALESHVLGAFLRDPYFPYCVCECAPKIEHHCPVVTAVINNELVNIATEIDVHYPGLNGPVVATIRGIGQYRLECCKEEDHQEPPVQELNVPQDPNGPQQPNGDHHKPKKDCKECKECHPEKNAKCPKVVWVHWNVSYNDCSLTCPPCFGVPTVE